MPSSNDEPTRADKWLTRIKNNPLGAAAYVFALTAIGALTVWSLLPPTPKNYLISAPKTLRIWRPKQESDRSERLTKQAPGPSEGMTKQAPGPSEGMAIQDPDQSSRLNGPTGNHFLPPKGKITLQASLSRVVDFPMRVRRVFVVETSIADLEIINPYQIVLIGHKPGSTGLVVWTTEGEHEEYKVNVTNGPTTEQFYPQENHVTIQRNMAHVIDSKTRLRKVSVADTEIADVDVVSPYQIVVTGHKPGSTTLTMWAIDGNYLEQQLHVTAAR